MGPDASRSPLFFVFYRDLRYLFLLVLFLSSSLFADEDLFKASMMSNRGGIASRSMIALEPASSEVPVDSSYQLGPGDFLDLMLEDNYLSVQVAPDGSIGIEECGVVFVGGKPLSEAREMILDLAAKRYKRDQCFATVSECLNSAAIFCIRSAESAVSGITTPA